MIYLNIYCTEFIFLVVIVYATYSTTILFLIHDYVNFPLVFKISLLFVKIDVYRF